MATLHQATIEPSKPQVLAEFLSSVDAWDVPAGTSVSRIGSYRFDDPAGEVGIETTLLTTSDARTFQVPLTYRAKSPGNSQSVSTGTTLALPRIR